MFEGVDMDDVLAIERESFGRDAWSRTLFQQFFRQCPDLFLIARVGRHTAGYSITCVGRRNAELTSIAVLERDRRGGVARALMDHSLAELRARNIKTWWLMVDVENAGAIRFYESYGFLTTKRVKRYYGPHRDAWRMNLELRPMNLELRPEQKSEEQRDPKNR